MKIRKEAKIGIFGVLMLALAYWGFNFLKGKDLLRSTNTYYAMYEQVGDVQVSAPILFKGVKIGVITGIDITNMKDEVAIKMNVRAKYHIPEDSKAKIVSASLLGGKAIEIEIGSSNNILQDGDTLRSQIDKGLLDMAGSEIELIKQKATLVVNEIVKTLSGINQLLSEQNLKNIDNILGNVSSLTANTNTLVANESKNISLLIKDLNTFTAALNESAPRLNNTISNIESITDSLKQANVHQVVIQANQLLTQLNTTIEALNKADGSAGKLIHDPELYNNLREASNSLTLLLKDVKENPGRYVKISVFGGGNKEAKAKKKEAKNGVLLQPETVVK